MANGYDPNVERIADSVAAIQTVLTAQWATQEGDAARRAAGRAPRAGPHPTAATALQGFLAGRWQRRDGNVYPT